MSHVILAHRGLGDSDTSRQMLQRAWDQAVRLTEAQDNGNRAEARVKIALARAENELNAGRHADGERWLAEAQKAGWSDTETATSQMYLRGQVALLRGDRSVALREWTRAGAAFAQGNLPQAVTIALSLASLQQTRREFGAARGTLEPLLQRARREAPGGVDEAALLAQEGRLELAQGRIPEARQRFEAAARIHESFRQGLAGDESRQNASALAAQAYLGLAESHLRTGHPGAALEAIERGRARTLAEQLAAPQRLYSPELQRRREKTLFARSLVLQRLAALPEADQVARAALQTQLIALRRSHENLEQAQRREAPALWATIAPEPLRVAQMRALVPDGTLLLVYQSGPERTLLLAMDRQGAVGGHVLRLSGPVLAQKIERFRQAIQRQDAAFAPLSRSLFDDLLAPVWPLVRRAGRLTLCLDGALSLLPFAALRVPDGAFVAERIALSHVVSLTTEALARPRRRRPRVDALALGDALYPATRAPRPERETARQSLRSLPGDPIPRTGPEAQAVARRFRGQALLRAQATRENVLKMAPHVRILHLACHGFVEGQEPLASGLRFAPTESDAGVLNAGDLYAGALSLQAELVTLSACQTGVGKVQEGEGIQSLTRAFQFAGADAVVSSLWRVEDDSTAALMDAFYAALQAGLAKDIALQKAMQAARSRSEISRLPLYWAGFVLTGNVAPLGTSVPRHG